MSQGNAGERGLAGFPEISLADACDKALTARGLVKDGVDPIADRQHDRGVPTFGKAADEVVVEQIKGFRNDKHKTQWAMTPNVCAAPLRSKSVDKVETVDVLAVVNPIWLEKPETPPALGAGLSAFSTPPRQRATGRAGARSMGGIWRTCSRSNPSCHAGTTQRWPVKVERIDIDALLRGRNHRLAEEGSRSVRASHNGLTASLSAP